MEWTWLDIGTYFFNYSTPGAVFGLVVGVIIGGFIAWPLLEGVFEISSKRAAIVHLFLTLLITLIGAGIASIPTHDKILAVKISKIKNEAVTKKNVNKSVEVIERLGKKLKCKYLGCEKESE